MPLTTKISLNCCKTLQENNTILRLSGCTCIASTGCLLYVTDKTATYTCLSVPHVGYVTGLTSSISTNLTNNYYTKTCINNYTGATDNRITALELVDNISITGATNGLTKHTTNDVCLGGILTNDTCINIGSDGNGLTVHSNDWRSWVMMYPTDDYYSNFFQIYSDTTGSTESNYFQLASGEWQFYNEYDSDNKNIININSNGFDICNTYDGILRTITFGNGNALCYGGDYSNVFTARSIPDVAYVTGLTSAGITSANNGLTKVGTNAVLGGNLTGNTCINLNSNTFCIFDVYSRFCYNEEDIELTVNSGGTGFWASCSADYVELFTVNKTCVKLDGINDIIGLCSNSGAYSCIDGINDHISMMTNNSSYIDIAGGINNCIEIATGAVGGVIRIDSTGGLSGCTEIYGTVLLITTPSTGSTSDSVLVRANDGTVKTVAGSSLGDKNNIYSYSAVTSNVTLSTGSTYVILANPSAEFTITLPATPTNGQVFKIKDISGQALTYNVIISGNGKNIDGYPMARINTDYGAFELIYNGIAWYTLSFVN